MKGEKNIGPSGDFLLEPCRDFIFKHLFGLEGQEERLLNLINAILKCNPPLESLKFMNPEIPRETLDGKTVRLDILAEVSNGTKINVEAQRRAVTNILERSLCYQARMMTMALRSGIDYGDIPAMVSLWITGRGTTKGRHYGHSEALFTFQDNGFDPAKVASHKFRTSILELPKIKIAANLEEEEDMFILWTAFLKNPGAILGSVMKRVKIIGETMADLRDMSEDEDFIRSWNEWRYLIDRKFDMIEGMKRGMKKGVERGIEKGIERGIEKGVRKTALAMLGDKVPLPTIVKYTGLPEREILRLMENPENNRWWG